MAITLDTVNTIADKLKDLPPPPPSSQPLTKAEALAKLKPQLQMLAKRGYNADQLAAILKADGLEVSARTLRKTLAQKKPAAC